MYFLSVATLKRRLINLSQSTDGSMSSSSKGSTTRTFLPPPHPSTLLHPKRSVPGHPSQEVDGMTPSLCSDNDNDTEDRVPMTPPLQPTRRLASRSQVSSMPIETSTRMATSERSATQISRASISHRDDPIPPDPGPSTNSRTLSKQPGDSRLSNDPSGDPFSRRPPSSPLLPETPRRPRAPARARSRHKDSSCPLTRSQAATLLKSQETDPFSFIPPDESTPALVPMGKRDATQIHAKRRRRRTLDQELRQASSSYSDEERAVNEQDDSNNYSDEERLVNDLNNGPFVGVGQRSERLGFLAHGGAGGEPVFMGVGYVEGAIPNDVAADKAIPEVVGRRKTRSSSRSPPKRKGRPKR